VNEWKPLPGFTPAASAMLPMAKARYQLCQHGQFTQHYTTRYGHFTKELRSVSCTSVW
jgi:hypothetical protein